MTGLRRVVAATVLCAALAAMSAWGGTPTRAECPVRFSWIKTCGDLDTDSGWKTIVPFTAQARGYLRANSIPYSFTASARLVVQFDPDDVWPGNTFSCLVWLEPIDAPDIVEITSDFGIEFGIETKPYWTDAVSLGITQDFVFEIEGNGGLPLGTNTLGGFDTVDFFSIPLDELVPGSSKAAKAIQTLFEVADYTSLNMASVSLAGEAAVAGHTVSFRLGNTDVVITNVGQASAEAASIYVPAELYDTLLNSWSFSIEPRYSFSIYKGVGLSLTAAGPLSLTINQRVHDRVGDMTPGGYTPPTVEDLNDAGFQVATDHASVGADQDCWLTFPVNQRPAMPDLCVHDIAVNPDQPADRGRAFAGEITTLGFTISNVGREPTAADGDLVYYVFVDGVQTHRVILNNTGAPPSLVIQPSSSAVVRCTWNFAEGPHVVDVRSGYSARKGVDGLGRPVYGLGDPNVNNNMRRFDLYVYPQRGTVMGRCFPNPDYPGAGIDGMRVRLSGRYRSWETNSAPHAEEHGLYRFNAVPGGDYQIQFLPPAPTNTVGPRYWPMSFQFTHAWGNVTDLSETGGMYLRQYQLLSGIIRNETSDGVENARVSVGDQQFASACTDRDGVFALTNVPPKGTFTLCIEHPDYVKKRVLYQMDVQATEQTNTVIARYYTLPETNQVDSQVIILATDAVSPVISVDPFPNGGRMSSPMQVVMRGSDNGGEDRPWQWRWVVCNMGGTPLYTGAWTNWPADGAPDWPTTNTVVLAGVPEGSYRFRVDARDKRLNSRSASLQDLVLDLTAPGFTVSVAGGVSAWSARTAPVTVTVTNSEPGTLSLQLSNDGVSWSEPWTFTGAVFTVQDWELTARDVYDNTVTVRARVTDAAGLSAVAQDDISVDTSGSVLLGGGWEAFTNTVVPLEINITPPDGVMLYYEPTYGGSLSVGAGADSRRRAQQIAIAATTTFNRVKIMMSDISGNPGDLRLSLVAALDNSDPDGNFGSLWSWSADAETLRHLSWAYLGAIAADTTNSVTLQPGIYHLVYSCVSGDVSNHYKISEGNADYGGHGRSSYVHDGAHWNAVPEPAPSAGRPTLALSLWNSPRGSVRISTDGILDTEPWIPFAPDPFRTVNAQGQGLFSATVAYSNAVDGSRDAVYTDSIVIDSSPPVIVSTNVLSADARSHCATFSFNVTDAWTRVAQMLWRFDGGPWQYDAYRSRTRVDCPDAFTNFTVMFGDAAGNRTAPLRIDWNEDIAAPSAVLSAATPFTNGTSVRLVVNAVDNRGVTAIRIRELRSGNHYPDMAATGVVTVALPQCRYPEGSHDWVDGAYRFEAVAADAAGNESAPSVAEVVMDRAAPVVESVRLTGPGGEAPAGGTNLLLAVDASDNLGPLEARWRPAAGAWSGWTPLARARGGIDVVAASDTNRYAVEVAVRDGAGNLAVTSAAVDINHAPGRPWGLRPYGYTGGPSNLLLGSQFVDPDSDDWRASDYALTRDTNVVLITGCLSGADRFWVPEGLTTAEVAYAWQCRYMDCHGAWSAWSEPRSFKWYTDTDRDGVPDFVEDATGTDPADPDTDNDGVPDGMEDLDADGEVDPGETSAVAGDTDKDGLADGEEDLDADARLDAAETSPVLADTDGDNSSDKHEADAGTDPRDSGSSFRIDSFKPSVTGQGTLQWQARGGRSYGVYAYTNLAKPGLCLTNLTATAGTGPWYKVIMQWKDQAPDASRPYYRIRLNP